MADVADSDELLVRVEVEQHVNGNGVLELEPDHMNGGDVDAQTAAVESQSHDSEAATPTLAPIINNDAFLQLEQPEDETLPVRALPTEIMIQILSMLSTFDLVRGATLVCTRWNLVTKQVLLRRFRDVNDRFPRRMRDLKSHVPKFLPGPVAAQLEMLKDANGLSAQFLRQIRDVQVLMLYHRTNFQIHDLVIGLHCESVRGLLQYHEEVAEEEHKSFLKALMHVASLSSFNLVFMMSHNLILVPTDTHLRFFVKQSADVPVDWLEYNSTPERSIPGRISVYEDVILASASARRSIFYIRVLKVDQENKKVNLDFLKEVFTPFFVESTLYLNGKIYILYENTRFVGQWTEATNTLDLSEVSTCGGDRRSFCRIGNLVFISPFDVPGEPAVWKCLDGSKDALILHDVQMSSLVQSIMPNLRDRAYKSVTKVYAFNNLFLAVCLPASEGSRSRDPEAAVAPMMILASVLKREPQLQDFTSVETFQSLFELPKTKTQKLMGRFRSELFYFLYGLNLFGEDDGGEFILRILKDFIND